MRVSSWSGDFDDSRVFDFWEFLKFFELEDEGGDWLEGFWISGNFSGQFLGLLVEQDGTGIDWHVDWAAVRLPPGGWIEDI